MSRIDQSLVKWEDQDITVEKENAFRPIFELYCPQDTTPPPKVSGREVQYDKETCLILYQGDAVHDLFHQPCWLMEAQCQYACSQSF